MGFIKLYDLDEPDGYISSRFIHYLDVEYDPGNCADDQSYIVRACLENEKIEEGYQVSPRIYNGIEAYLYLDSIIEKLRGNND